MNHATTNEAGAIYNTYLNSFKNEDGSVNIPVTLRPYMGGKEVLIPKK